MPRYAVTVTASFDAPRAPDDTLALLRRWAASMDGRTFIVDDSVPPVRWTATADYGLDADGDHAAEELAKERFGREMHTAGICSPETIVAATGPFAEEG